MKAQSLPIFQFVVIVIRTAVHWKYVVMSFCWHGSLFSSCSIHSMCTAVHLNSWLQACTVKSSFNRPLKCPTLHVIWVINQCKMMIKEVSSWFVHLIDFLCVALVGFTSIKYKIPEWFCDYVTGEGSYNNIFLCDDVRTGEHYLICFTMPALTCLQQFIHI